MDRALYLLLVTFNESWCDAVEGKEWSASNASEAEEILPKCAKEKIKYSGLSLTNHHPFNMLELRLISKGWLDFSLLLVPFQMPHRGSANPLRSSSLCPRGSISRIPGCLHRTNPGTSREKPGPHFAWLKDTQSHNISLPQCGPTGRSWFKAVQIRMQLSTPQTCTVGRENMHTVCVMGLRGQRQTAEEAQAAKKWTGEGNWDQHCSEAYRSRLTTSPHFFLLPHGLEHHRDQRLQGSTFRSAYIIFGYCLQGLLSFSNLPWNSQSPQEWPMAALRPPCGVMSYRGRPWLHLMCWLIFIISQWPSFLCSIFFFSRTSLRKNRAEKSEEGRSWEPACHLTMTWVMTRKHSTPLWETTSCLVSVRTNTQLSSWFPGAKYTVCWQRRAAPSSPRNRGLTQMALPRWEVQKSHLEDKELHCCDSLDGAVVKNLPANAGDTGSIPDLGRSHMLQSN